MKKRKITTVLTAFVLVAAMAAALSSCNKDEGGSGESGSEKEKKYTVGICQLAPHPALDEATRGFKEQLQKELGENVVLLENNAQDEASSCTAIINDYVTKKVDLIMANATGALQAAANGTTTIPVLGTSVTEYGTALGISDFKGLVGSNISGTSDLAPLDQQAKMVKDIFPQAKKVAILYSSSEPNSAYQVKIVKAELEKLGLVCDPLPFTDTNDVSAVAAKAAGYDVIYIPTDNTAATCASTILGVIKDTPVIAGEENVCKACGVATLTINYYDLGAATGKMAAKILKGEADISNMEIEYADRFTKKYNPARCRELGVDTAALEADGYTAITE